MPKIIPTPLAPARANVRATTAVNGAADASLARSSRAVARKSDRANGFDEVLSGARQRSEEPTPVERDRTQAAPANPKPAKPKQRPAKREVSAEEPAASEAPLGAEAGSETSSSCNDVTAEQQTDDSTTTGEQQPVDDADQIDDESPDPHAPTAAHTRVEAVDAQPIPDVSELIAESQVAAAAVDAQVLNSTDAGNSDADKTVSGVNPAASRKPVSPLIDGIRSQENQPAEVLNVASTPTQQLATAAIDDVSAGRGSTTETKRNMLPTAGVARAVSPPVSPETSAASGSDAKRALPDAGEALVASSAADLVETIDTAETPSPTTAPHAGVAAPDPSASAARALENFVPHHTSTIDGPAPGSVSQPPAEVRFAEDNHPTIVNGIRGQLLPTGGTMHIRLDPPELGPMAITVRLHNGVMEASFETTSDEAAKLLSHSLGALKTSLESQGVNVERLHVQQAPKSEQSNSGGNNDRDQQQNRDPQHEQAARQDHQRREMLRRMWRKLTGVEDPLDMVA